MNTAEPHRGLLDASAGAAARAGSAGLVGVTVVPPRSPTPVR